MNTEEPISRRKFMKLTGAVGAASVGIAVTTTAGCTTAISEKSFIDVSIGDISGLCPSSTWDSASWEAIMNCAETLLFYDEEDISDATPALATSYDVSADGKTYTFTLKSDVKFHDDETMTASDVKYSFDRGAKRFGESFTYLVTLFLKGGATWYGSDLTDADFDAYLAEEAVKVIDDSTVSVTLEDPYPFMHFVFTTVCTSILSEASYPALSDMVAGEPDTFADANIIGTGPYMFDEWIAATSISYDRFPDYHDALPYLKHVTQIWQGEWSSRQLMILSGEAQSVYVSATNFDEVATYDAGTGEWTGNEGLVCGLTDVLVVGSIGCSFNLPPLDDLDVRKAIMYGLDKVTVLENALNNIGVPATHPIPPAMVDAYDLDMSGVTTYEFDTTKSKDHLEAAGYTTSSKCELELSYNEGNDSRKQICLNLKDNLEGTGLADVTVNELTWSVYLQIYATLPMQYMAWQADYPSFDNMAQAYLDSSYYFAPRISWSNAVCDARIAEIMDYDTTDARRAEALVEGINACNEDAAFLYTYWSKGTYCTLDTVDYDWDKYNAMYPGVLPPYKFVGLTE